MAYTECQVDLIANAQSKQNAIATRIAYQAGLKASELYTLICEDGTSYSVLNRGKRRPIHLKDALAQELEKFRLSNPQVIVDRGVEYTVFYSIGGGQSWSKSFSAASKRVLGWSRGAHGLRHSYAQKRMHELRYEHVRDEAAQIVGNEMGVTGQRVIEFYLR